MSPVALLLVVALAADPPADAPRLVVKAPAGTTFAQDMVCMDDQTAESIAVDRLTCEGERDRCLKREADSGAFNAKWAVVGGVVGVVIGAVVAGAAVLALKK